MRWLAVLATVVATSALAQSPPFSQVERGKYLTQAGDCAACHTAPGGAPFAGGLGLNTPFGTIYASNITPDPETGIGRWSKDDLWRLLHEGIARKGGHIYPAMPYPWTTRTTREDSDAIYAYLQVLPAVRQRKPENTLIPPLNLRFSLTGWNILFFSPEVFRPDPAKTPEWNRGAYLVTGLGHCGGCHTALNALGAPENSRALRGNVLDNWYAPNITGDKVKGIGGWTGDDVVEYLKTGRNAHAIAAGPMAEVVTKSTQYLTPDDLHAIAAYLDDQPSPGVSSRRAPVPAAALTAGADLFRDNCSACHGAEGKGVAALIPSLLGPVVAGDDPTGVVRVILHGAETNHTQSAPTSPGMPAFDWKLSDSEIAALATYVRARWGDRDDAVRPGKVRQLRSKLFTSTQQ